MLFSENIFGQQKQFFWVNNKKVYISSLNSKLSRAMKDLGIPGISLAVIDNNKVVFSEGLGYKLRNAGVVDDKTIFEACSLSKTFLVYVAYRLADEGKLDLDKPMWEYMKNENLANDSRYKLITARMLLSHCSGIENWRTMNDPDSLEITAQPGTQYVYSGEGYHYLAEVIQIILDEAYEKTIKRMVLGPLQLFRSFTSYSKDGKYPTNYATGHDLTGHKIEKWKNDSPVPASGVHTTARDYANLIINFFKPGNFSETSIKNILHPAVRIINSDPASYYGPGFEIIYSADDTIISHGGANTGFRNIMFYSVKNKRGFVLMTNHEWGKKLAKLVCEETAGISITPRLVQDDFEDQYPDNTALLLKKYRQKGFDTMLAAIQQLKLSGQLGPKTLSELGYSFLSEGKESVMKDFFSQNIALFPVRTFPYLDYGYYYLDKPDYDSAYKYFNQIRIFGGDTTMMIYQLRYCEKKLGRPVSYYKSFPGLPSFPESVTNNSGLSFYNSTRRKWLHKSGTSLVF